MSKLPVAHETARCHDPELVITLTYDARFLRRKALKADDGTPFLVDLPKVTSVNIGDAFVLSDGRKIGVAPADEPLLEIRGEHLPKLAWHIGNRHTPCQINAENLWIQRDHVMRDMLQKIGAEIREIEAPFTPEGGAYGHGRTHGHAHDHEHGPEKADGTAHAQ